MARRDAARGDAPAPPRGLVPVLRFNRLPDRALAEVRRALDSDDGFRARVLESLTDSTLDSMDRGARLFLERPEGWEESLGLIEAEVSHEADRSDIVATVRHYLSSPKGWIEDARPCGRLRFCLTGRVPPISSEG